MDGEVAYQAGFGEASSLLLLLHHLNNNCTNLGNRYLQVQLSSTESKVGNVDISTERRPGHMFPRRCVLEQKCGLNAVGVSVSTDREEGNRCMFQHN